jgi:hypothetical protein
MPRFVPQRLPAISPVTSRDPYEFFYNRSKLFPMLLKAGQYSEIAQSSTGRQYLRTLARGSIVAREC